MENINKITAALEAILFIYGEPLTLKKIAKILDIEEAAAKTILEELSQQYQNESRGLKLIFSDSPKASVQLVTKPELASLLENLVKEEYKENLTPVAIETVSLIAYLGPLSRPQIDYYRGVNSSFTLRNLLIRGLIDRFPDPQKNNLYLYQASFDLLRYLGISKIEELPEYEKFKELN